MFKFAIFCWIFATVALADRPLMCRVNENVCIFKSKVLHFGQKVTIAAYREDTCSDDSDITRVDFTSSSIDFVPSELFTTFENLEHLEMQNQKLKEMDRDTFMNAKSLKVLQLHTNKLRKLSAFNFRGADNLKHIFIPTNEIQEIDEDAFRNMVDLELIHLCENNLKEIHKNTFKTLLKLNDVSLNANQIEFLPPNLFSNNHRLHTLHLRTNRFKTISNKMFSHLINLQHLYLNGNICIDKTYTPNAFAVMGTVENDLGNCTKNFSFELRDNSGDEELSIDGKLLKILGKINERFDVLDKTVERIEGKVTASA
jgi:hypothetical protein